MSDSNLTLVSYLYDLATKSSFMVGVKDLSEEIIERHIRRSGISNQLFVELLTAYIKIACAVQILLSYEEQLIEAMANHDDQVEQRIKNLARSLINEYGDGIDTSKLDTMEGIRSQLGAIDDPDEYLPWLEILCGEFEAKEAEFSKDLIEVETIKANICFLIEMMLERLPDKVTWHPKTWRFLFTGSTTREDFVAAVIQLETYMSDKKARNALLLDISTNQNR